MGGQDSAGDSVDIDGSGRGKLLAIANTSAGVAEVLAGPGEVPVALGEGETVEWVNMCWRKAWRVY